MAGAKRASGVTGDERPMRVFAALLFQLANPKALTATVALASLVLVPAGYNLWLLGAVFVVIVPLCLLANGPWALAGQTIGRILSTPLRWNSFTVATAGLTAACTLFLWF
jgi:threonine/homoserine/homoserine lactone efflux protein